MASLMETSSSFTASESAKENPVCALTDLVKRSKWTHCQLCFFSVLLSESVQVAIWMEP
eukprot:m.354237 g.354237  ORF g.354237 m.354237 type:complete len:59 (-) comp16594_c0_seq11:1254-1430(-)